MKNLSNSQNLDHLYEARRRVIACATVIEEMLPFLPADVPHEILDFGLHLNPAELKKVLQEKIVEASRYADVLLLGYGLCSMAVVGLKASTATLVIPRTDDCIAILLGSYKRYIQEFDATPGTYYLTKGWLESGSNPLQEYQEILAKYGEKDATWIMDQQYQHYERIAFVAHNQEDLEKYRPKAIEVAEYCKRWGMRYEEILGSDIYVRRLIEIASSPNKADADFVVIPPGGEVTQEMFMR